MGGSGGREPPLVFSCTQMGEQLEMGEPMPLQRPLRTPQVIILKTFWLHFAMIFDPCNFVTFRAYVVKLSDLRSLTIF